MTIAPEAPATPAPPTFLELEITGRCQLTCTHCYAESGPAKGHGTMTTGEWQRIITEAAAMGVQTVQLIGGEPTMHPDFAALVEHALSCGLRVQVYSNLYRIGLKEWAVLGRPGVDVATSYYSDDAAEHDVITGRKGSHDATRANIPEAIRRGIDVKVGIIHMREGQRSEQARTEVEALGVKEVSVDRVREVGNAATSLPSTSALCGRCAHGIAAILPDGTVTPCVMGRFLPAGNVQGASLEGVFASDRWQHVATSIPQPRPTACHPDCNPAHSDSCAPDKGTPCQPMGFSPDRPLRLRRAFHRTPRASRDSPLACPSTSVGRRVRGLEASCRPDGR
ncbi:radical SAM protein [Streptomyces sp. NPDC002851]